MDEANINCIRADLKLFHFFKCTISNFLAIFAFTVFPHIISALEKFHPLNSFPSKKSVRIRDIVATIWIGYNFQIEKKNGDPLERVFKLFRSCITWYIRTHALEIVDSFRRIHMRKYGNALHRENWNLLLIQHLFYRLWRCLPSVWWPRTDFPWMLEPRENCW